MLAGRSVAAAMAETRAVIGPAKLPLREEDAQRCLDKLAVGEAYTAAEWAALELVVRLMRPAVMTNQGVPAPLPAYGSREPELGQLWESFRVRAGALVPSVGRIDDAAERHVGTGFVVAPDLVLTNRHVLSMISYGTNEMIQGATINFQREYDAADTGRAINLTGVAAVHDELDLALLRAARLPPSLPRDGSTLAPDAWLVAVGYPGEVLPPPVHAAVFQGSLGVRRTSPGVVRNSSARMIRHDCSTMGGSSGSPLLALDTGAVVGVHYEGRSAYENHAIPIAHVDSMLSGAGGPG